MLSTLNSHKLLIIPKTGLLGGRNFLKNLVDIDASGRIYGNAYEGKNWYVTSKELPRQAPRGHIPNPSNIPISGAFDFKAAFPSVIHLWIWVVLRHRKMPGHFYQFVQSNL